MSEAPNISAQPQTCIWLSDLPAFYGAQTSVVRFKTREQFIRDALLQRDCKEAADADDSTRLGSTILEASTPQPSGPVRRPGRSSNESPPSRNKVGYNAPRWIYTLLA